jgi:WS/DGAT/MGAT family acyltransferase
MDDQQPPNRPAPTASLRLDRLSPQDMSNLWVEARGQPMHIAALAVLDTTPFPDPRGAPQLETLRSEIEHRLHLAPRLRQRLHRPPPGGGVPLWVDDPGFAIAEHVRAHTVAPPGDEAALVAACQELNQQALDRSRPLWELWLLTGLRGGRAALLIRLHHVLADGVAAVALMNSLLDTAPDTRPPSVPTWIPAPLPPFRVLLADNLRSRSRAVIHALAAFAHPATWLRRMGLAAAAAREVVRDGLAPASSLNGSVGQHRRLLLARADLGRAKSVAHAHGAKVNDVALAAVAGGARALLQHRGELTPALVLRASVPVSVRGADDPRAQGNRVGIMTVPLPVAEPDPVRRLAHIARTTAHSKRQPRGPVTDPLLGSYILRRGLPYLMGHQRLVNMFTSNVPGPSTPRYFAGARIVEVFQIGGVQGNVRLSVGVLSYMGQLNFDIVGDAESCPDLDLFAEGLRTALGELGVVT